MFNFLKSWLLIMAQHVLFTAAEQNIIPIDRYGNITHKTDSWSRLMHWHRHDDVQMFHTQDEGHRRGQNVLRADDSDRWRWKRSTRRRVTDEVQNVLHADDSDRWRWKRSTCRRQPQTKVQTLPMIQTFDDTHTMSLQKTTVLYYLNGPQRRDVVLGTFICTVLVLKYYHIIWKKVHTLQQYNDTQASPSKLYLHVPTTLSVAGIKFSSWQSVYWWDLSCGQTGTALVNK